MGDIKGSYTNRGFYIYEFKDGYGEECSLQKSSIVADEEYVWLGRDKNADPHPILGVELSPRMHLSQSQAKWLGRVLIRFSKTGHLGDD